MRGSQGKVTFSVNILEVQGEEGLRQVYTGNKLVVAVL
jgi:hypothetical protein